MEVRILGSGGSEGIPAFLCRCPVCAAARRRGGPEIRQNAGAVVTLASGLAILLDMPPQFKTAWDQSGLDQERLAGILITHRHADHTLGMKYLIDATPKNGVFEAVAVTAYMPADVLENRLRSLDPANDYPPEGRQGPFVRFEPLEPNRTITLAGCRVTPLETNHLTGGGAAGQSFGYLLEDSDGTRMAYMVDAQPDLPARTAEALLSQRLDCLIWECTFAKLDKTVGHTDIAGLIGVGRRFAPRKLVATHISHQTLGHRELEEVLAPEGILVAHDGMRILVTPPT